MLFNSFSFFIFFPVVTLLYFILPFRYRWFHLLLASCIFYCAFVPAYIIILFFTIIIDYFAGILIDREKGRKRKWWLVASLISNIGVLAVFKYYNFFIDNVNALLHLSHLSAGSLPILRILLPIGLSFHTFQAMSYTIEVYRGNYPPERHFGIYALYVMFFPQLVAGPIERPQNILPQLHEEHKPNPSLIGSGLRLMAWGYFKKMVIADHLGMYVDKVYDTPGQFGGFPTLIALVFFAFQIYCDFSGYTDIAIGSARVMGYDLMKNFDRPFISKNMTEFWRRWHISLSTWFNDYLFTPLVIAKRNWGKGAVVFALLITFFISGFWHGAGWTFLIFGLLHGIAIIFEFLTKKFRLQLSTRIPAFLYGPGSQLLTFAYLCFTWIFFRSQNIHVVLTTIKNCFRGYDWRHPGFTTNIVNRYDFYVSIFFTLSLILLEFLLFSRNGRQKFLQFNLGVRLACYILLCLVILCFGLFNHSRFIYFQF